MGAEFKERVRAAYRALLFINVPTPEDPKAREEIEAIRDELSGEPIERMFEAIRLANLELRERLR